MVHWPGEPEVTLRKISDMSNGKQANVTAISMSAHTGTHIDAPRHFLKDGKDISQFPLELCSGRTKIIVIENTRSITAGELQQHHIAENDRILFHTKNSESDWTNEPFKDENYVYISTEAAGYLAEKKVAMIGVDYLSVGGKNNGREVHTALLESGIWIIEGLILKDVPEGQYDYICLPLKLLGSDGAPARIVIKIP